MTWQHADAMARKQAAKHLRWLASEIERGTPIAGCTFILPQGVGGRFVTQLFLPDEDPGIALDFLIAEVKAGLPKLTDEAAMLKISPLVRKGG